MAASSSGLGYEKKILDNKLASSLIYRPWNTLLGSFLVSDVFKGSRSSIEGRLPLRYGADLNLLISLGVGKGMYAELVRFFKFILIAGRAMLALSGCTSCGRDVTWYESAFSIVGSNGFIC